MNVVIFDICNAIPLLTSNYRNNGEHKNCEWYTNMVSHNDIRRDFGMIYDEVISRNNARLIKAFNGLCFLIEYMGLCFRIGFCRHFTGEIQVFVDFEENAENYLEYELSDDDLYI